MNKSEQRSFETIFNIIKEEKENGRIFSEQDICNKVDELLPFLIGLYSTEEIRQTVIINELLLNVNVSIGSSETIYNINNRKWINDFKRDNHDNDAFKHWNNYKKYLSEKVNLTDDVILEIDKSTDQILDGMENPIIQNFNKKGMVIGYVQSGKTSNYVGLINKSIDVGYKFIVVLAGMHNNLRQQTQMRIDQGVIGTTMLNGERTRCGVGEIIRDLPNIQFLTTSDFNGDFNTILAQQNGVNFNLDVPLIAVVKKNITVLSNLNTWLENFIGLDNIQQSDKPILIIDDECDQASINTKFNPKNYDLAIEDENGNTNNNNTPSAINGQIINLIQKFNKRAYVGYTATPYANIFIPIDNNNYQDIYPEDFIVRLDQPSNYLGPEKYFDVSDSEDETLPGIHITTDEEGFYEEIRQYMNDPDRNNITIPNSLLAATYMFILSGAIRIFRGQQNKHMSMLIHVKHLTLVQNHLKRQFEIKWTEICDEIRANNTIIHNQLKDLYEGNFGSEMGLTANVLEQSEITSIYSNNSPYEDFSVPESYDNLKQFISQFISDVDIISVNSGSDDNLNYHLYRNGRRVIAIGGNTMARGLTLEGLHTSYFVRAAGAYDTLMQMGRWFGYRKHYSDLCRIITTDSIAENFGEVCKAEIMIRNDISQMIKANVSPRDFLIRIRTSANSFVITGKKGMAGEMHTQWSGGEIISRLISKDTQIVKNNFKVLNELINILTNNTPPIVEKNNIIFRNVSRRFISNLSALNLVNNNVQLNLQKIEEYYELCEFDTIDLVIIGKAIDSKQLEFATNFVFSNYEIGLAERNSDMTKGNDIEFFRVKNSKLTDSKYLSNFITEAEKTVLTEKQLQTPNIICSKIKRPIISILPINPYYFYSKEQIDRKSRPSKDKIDDKIKDLMNAETSEFESIPFGISIATPLYGKNNKVLTQETVMINLAIQNAINL